MCGGQRRRRDRDMGEWAQLTSPQELQVLGVEHAGAEGLVSQHRDMVQRSRERR